MASIDPKTDGPSPFSTLAFDFTLLPDYDDDLVNEDDIAAFAKALAAPENAHDEITALNDWRPVYQRTRRRGSRKPKRKKFPRRGVDEKREGFVYSILQWPLLLIVLAWIITLGISYLLTRLYIFLYEHFVTIRGKRDQLRRNMRSTTTYDQWIVAAKEMDVFLGTEKWKKTDEYAYYDSTTIRRVRDEMKSLREALDRKEKIQRPTAGNPQALDDLRALVEAAVKGNFAGVENSRLYSETYYGTKDLVQSFIDEVELSLNALSKSTILKQEEKTAMCKQLYTNYGRTALCLSGGATFAYYHFGVAKALIDADLLPEVITGTSGGALVACLLCTRTDEELKKLLVPALAGRIKACQDPFKVWFPRWWRTGARFDSIEWARRCSWFTHGSLTFREAYARSGRILNITCVPSDPHSPAILANYLTSPDCVIWSACLASAAVPGILNPVVLMRKNRDGTLSPYSFGHKWKDGSLRTDIPLKALNTHFNVSFSIVSQVNPHINLFFFSSRGTVGRPVTHRRGRGWRGGFLGSATEQYLKLDLTKWLKVLRHLELLPRPLGQDWSEIWLQRFSGTITIWPRTRFSDFTHILSDPSPSRLAHMLHVGQLSTFPKLKFIANRMKIERLIEAGRARDFESTISNDTENLPPSSSEEDLQTLLDSQLLHPSTNGGNIPYAGMLQHSISSPPSLSRPHSPSMSQRISGWFTPSRSPHLRATSPETPQPGSTHRSDDFTRLAAGSSVASLSGQARLSPRRGSMIAELRRQGGVFFDDDDAEDDDETAGEDSEELDNN